MLDDLDPVLDPARLRAVAALDVFSSGARTRLDHYARRAAEQLNGDIGAVSMMLDGAVFFAGSHGASGWIAAAEGMPAEFALCAGAVRRRSTYVLEDATLDAEQHTNPLVTVDGIRSYAGAPLVTAEGFVVGACCVVGLSPRRFTPADIAILEALAAEIVEALETTQSSLA